MGGEAWLAARALSSPGVLGQRGGGAGRGSDDGGVILGRPSLASAVRAVAGQLENDFTSRGEDPGLADGKKKATPQSPPVLSVEPPSVARGNKALLVKGPPEESPSGAATKGATRTGTTLRALRASPCLQRQRPCYVVWDTCAMHVATVVFARRREWMGITTLAYYT